jgi:hypothetical protein
MPLGVIEKSIEEVGSENRALVWKTLDEVNGDAVYNHGSIEEGINHVVARVREKNPEARPKPATPARDPLDDGSPFVASEMPREGLASAMAERRNRKWRNGQPGRY